MLGHKPPCWSDWYSEPVWSSLPLTAQDFTCEKSQKSLKNIFLLIAHKPKDKRGQSPYLTHRGIKHPGSVMIDSFFIF